MAKRIKSKQGDDYEVTGEYSVDEIRSIHGDTYNVTNKYSADEEGVSSCGNCFSCRNMCDTGRGFVYSYTDFGGA